MYCRCSLLIVILSFAGSLLTSSPVQAQQPPRLHVILAGDESDPNIGNMVTDNHYLIRKSIRSVINGRYLSIVDVSSPLINPTLRNPNDPQQFQEKLTLKHLNTTMKAIRQGITERDPSTGDTYESVPKFRAGDSILFYYMGHGLYSTRTSEHVLNYSGGGVPRKMVQNLLETNFPQARVIALVTESCANYDFEWKFVPKVLATGDFISPVMQRLFFDSQGIANINSCQFGQIALTNYYYIDPETGKRKASVEAPFTTALMTYLNDHADNRRATWEDLYQKVSAQTSQYFKDTYPNGRDVKALSGEYVKQRSQDPIFLGELPKIPTQLGENDPKIPDPPLPDPPFPPNGGPDKGSDSFDPGNPQGIPDPPRPFPNGEEPKAPNLGANARLGASVEQVQGGGLKVLQVSQNSPAAFTFDGRNQVVSLQPGDILLSIDGKQIDGIDDLLRGLRGANSKVTLVVRRTNGVRVELQTYVKE